MLTVILAIEVACLFILCGIFSFIALREEKENKSLKEELTKKCDDYLALSMDYDVLDQKYSELEDRLNASSEDTSDDFKNQLDHLLELQHKDKTNRI